MQDDGKFSSDKKNIFWLQFQDYDDSPMFSVEIVIINF